MKPISIQSGIIYVDDGIQGWTLNSGSGNRYFWGYIKFAQPFAETPHVIISLADEDEDEDQLELVVPEIPVECIAEEVTREGFKFRFGTWGKHRVESVTARWVAMAQ